MNAQLKLDFQLLGTSISPKKITQLTGILPNTALLKGERNAKIVLPRQNVWSIESHADSNELADHWAEFESKFIDSKEIFREIAMTGIARLTIVVNSKNRIPSITIPASMSKFAGYVNAVIDIDHIQF